MRDLQRERGLTYVLISHNLAVVRHFSNRVAVMYLGRIVEQGDTDQVFHQPRHPYTRLLIESIPRLEPDAPERAVLQGEVPNPLSPPTGCVFHPRCPHANARCRAELPTLREVDDRIIACHAVEESRLSYPAAS